MHTSVGKVIPKIIEVQGAASVYLFSVIVGVQCSVHSVINYTKISIYMYIHLIAHN